MEDQAILAHLVCLVSKVTQDLVFQDLRATLAYQVYLVTQVSQDLKELRDSQETQ